MPVENTTSYSSVRLYVVMGAAGCGKSTIGEELAAIFEAKFFEGDDFHSPENKAKMAAGTALTDDDRWPWLRTLVNAMCEGKQTTVSSCSSLKRSYRDLIREHANEPVVFIHLHGSRELLSARLSGREEHFMNSSLLDSQIETLEPLDSSELGITVDINATVPQFLDVIVKRLESSSF